LLLDALDAKMKGMDHVDGAIKGLFEVIQKKNFLKYSGTSTKLRKMHKCGL